MNFDAEKFLTDYNISYETSGPNISAGWIGLQCPFCHDHSTHGGFNLEKGYYYCWICGRGYGTYNIIQELLGCDFYESKQIVENYSNTIHIPSTKKYKEKKKNDYLVLPSTFGRLEKTHKEYLLYRNFDPNKLEKKFHLLGSNHLGSHKFRIIAPIYFNKKLVSYQGRDITGKSKLRYKACKTTEEVIHHKHILYNIDNALTDKCIIVEGVTDVWRLGDNCVATFGTSFTNEQIELIYKRFKTVFLLFDTDDHSAYRKAEKMGEKLNFMGIHVDLIEIDVHDPAELTQKDADYLKKELFS
jgi:DNA primase